MSTIDQQFVEFIVKTLVSKPEKVTVERTIDERGVLLSLTVDPEDVGRVIGKRGATAQSIRTLLRVLGTKNGARYNLKIVNTDDYIAGAPESKAESKADEPIDEVEETVAEEEAKEQAEEDHDNSELAEKTRAELADLDDLDI
ncbi:KH domain-containing protein [Candidatus Saccharibacteria bacterium]|nr:KH domain-containing protein [Candidatus Saccharibacteria bacterium]